MKNWYSAIGWNRRPSAHRRSLLVVRDDQRYRVHNQQGRATFTICDGRTAEVRKYVATLCAQMCCSPD
ncbi:hypothetical protein [Streptomyces sp. SID9727]|uniref:hypothetical protein n=1 Tax=Streptomyces sp. SID9727 TaxID=2706114 RepID=UPI0013C54F99|nr:hypothetical protein [Streptomyces sp. SID9727]NEC68864.1 hypothetical protein [Streptomyces sp. SID9727]